MWVVITICLRFAKLSLPLPSTKYLFSVMKNIPTVKWDSRHWVISLYTKALPSPSSKFVQQVETKSKELSDLDAIKVSGPNTTTEST